MYRSRNDRQQEKMAAAFLWLLALVCAVYISWKINPYPIRQGIEWVGDQTEQFFDRCMEQALSQTIPAISCFFFPESSNTSENASKNTNTNRIEETEITMITTDPFYTRYLSFSHPGDG